MYVCVCVGVDDTTGIYSFAQGFTFLRNTVSGLGLLKYMDGIRRGKAFLLYTHWELKRGKKKKNQIE